MKTLHWILVFCLVASLSYAFPFGKSGDQRKKDPGVVTEDAAREIWMQGYVKMQEGKRAEDDDNRMVALELYREAAAAFSEVKAKHPEWNPALVQYRLDYVQTRVRRLGTVAVESASDLTKGELLALTEEQQKRIQELESKVESLTTARDELSGRVSELQGRVNELRDAEQTIAELNARINDLQADNEQMAASGDRLRDRITTLEEQVRELEAERQRLLEQQGVDVTATADELKSARAKLEELTEQNTALSEQLDAQKSTLNDCRDEREALQKRVAALSGQQRDQDGNTAELRESNEKLANQMETLRQETDRLAADLQQANRELAKAKQEEQQRNALQNQIATLQGDLETREERIAELNKTIAHLAGFGGEAATGDPGHAGGADGAPAEELAQHLEDARAAERAGTMDAAINAYRAVLEIQPDNTEVRLHLGTLLLDRGANAEAQEVLDPAFSSNPDNTEIYTPLGLSMLRQEKADLALAIFARGVALEPRNADFHRYLGLASRSLGWTDATEAAFRRSFKLDDTSGETAYNLALHYMTLDKPRVAEAKQWYDKAIELGQPPDEQLEEAINAFMKGE